MKKLDSEENNAMSEKYTKYNTTINDIEFKMLRKNDNCWIKAEPIKRVSTHSSLHIILNDEEHHWDVYDENGREIHQIYFKGYKSLPSFYLKTGKNRFRIDCSYDKINVIPITENHTMDKYIKKNCNCTSPQASCWANALYYTKRPDKPPFDQM